MADRSLQSLRTRKAFVAVARAISYLVYFYLVAVEIILGLGFFLLLFGANPSADFTEWVYRNLDRVMEPFRGIFTPIQLGTTNGNVESIFETSVLFAMIVYGILAMVISALVSWLSSRVRRLEVEEANAERLEQQYALTGAGGSPARPTAAPAVPPVPPAAVPPAPPVA